ncbi:D-alanyl-D-alanine carboxypeptidase family protein [uncultured Maritimibacter sp.]|jgi:D-alanyl-D-alanine carboxypeptidase (penicillin-binding protein 5/6)|uniref:D-alanyl-D-alanine carboxypeptidase family protein n=1 Tax=uncultured Maritimibacter sp. TaxID=991866 RepID=UPI002619EBF8|nr:D-alanyl-D-alanine carboxypeptidase family protein [uncultured Maritimibacter sp.]
MTRRCHVLARTGLAALLALSTTLPGWAFETAATSAYVVDLTTDTVLMEKNADVPLPPASMSKLMTLNMLFEALEDGRVSLDTRFNVSERAMAMGGSTMFLNTQDKPTVEELIKGIIVLSGNDACVVVAEGLGGTEDAFSSQMTERARALGMSNSTFGNSSGWPHPAQRMSMHDLGILAERLIEHFPQYYHYFGIQEFDFDGRAPDNRHNRNPLLSLGMGADGLKTGHTEEAGYGLVGSAMQGSRRIVFVISGLSSDVERRNESASILNWSFRQFAMRTPVKAGQVIAEVPVWLGDAATVALAPAEDLELLMPVTASGSIEGKVDWTGPIEAPVAQGTQLATLTITRAGMGETVVPLVATTSVAEAGFGPKFKAAATQALVMARNLADRDGAGDTTSETPSVTPAATDAPAAPADAAPAAAAN